MKVVSDLSDAALNEPSVLSIGNFDGLHLGHQAILRKVVERARRLQVRPAVLTFSPHPVRVLAPDVAPKLISTLPQKIRLLEGAGIELLFIAKFDMPFAAVTPEDFIRNYLVDGLRAKALCVGSNFTFGHRQAGTIETLKQWRHEFEVIEVASVSTRRVVVSSTQIRRRIQEGKVSQACRLLGRWFEIEGRIVAGAGRGRNVTVPTLNLEPENELVPCQGVYITRTEMDHGPWVDSITNVGTRPTFGGGFQTIETFVLKASVPGEPSTARLQFIRRVRDERQFDSPELLREQIGRDVQAATKFFRRLHLRDERSECKPGTAQQSNNDARIHTN
jgi:riboflavin kinase/FMN adenylyltransferase